MVKRIALISPRYRPDIGGVEKHVTELAEGLVRHDISVDIVTTDPTGRLPKTETINGVRVFRFGTLRNDAVFFVSPPVSTWLNQYSGQYDLLHAHSYHTPLAFQAALAARRFKIPFVVTPHYHGSGHTNFRQFLHIPYRIPGMWMIKQAQLIICVSSAEQTLIHRHFGNKLTTTVIPNGVEQDLLRQATPFPKTPNSVLLLSVGRLEHYKQVSKLVRAMRLLPDNYHLAITGKGPADDEITQLINQLHLNNRVQLLGHVSTEDLGRWYKTADIYVTISQHEAFGISLLEGVVSGAKIVASSIPAYHEVSHFIKDAESIITFVQPDCSISELANLVVKAEARPDVHNIDQSALPNWDNVVDLTIKQYNLIFHQERMIAAS